MEVQSIPIPQNGSVLLEKKFTVSNRYSIKHISEKMDKGASVYGKDKKYTIEPVVESDRDVLLDMLKNNFFKDEPLNAFLELGECSELEIYSMKNIKHDFSFKAVSPSGEVIGVLMNGVIRREKPTIAEKKPHELCKHPKFRKILALMDAIDQQFNIFDMFPDVDEIVDAQILSVDESYRGQGVAYELIQRTLELMKQRKIPVMHVLCSSEFSARLMVKLGFREVFTYPYNEFKENGVQVLSPEPPHVAARICVREVIFKLSEQSERNKTHLAY